MTTTAKASALVLLTCSTLAGARIGAQTGAQTTATHHTASGTKARTAARAAAKPCPPSTPDPVTPAGLPPAVGPVQTALALRYIDTVVGTGEPVMPGASVTVQYTGWLASNGTKFDSSLDHGQAYSFQLGAHRVISGWDEGFVGMHVGGKRRLFVPSYFGYGEDGRPPVIPENSDLIFDMELVSANNPSPPPSQQPSN